MLTYNLNDIRLRDLENLMVDFKANVERRLQKVISELPTKYIN